MMPPSSSSLGGDGEGMGGRLTHSLLLGGTGGGTHLGRRGAGTGFLRGAATGTPALEEEEEEETPLGW